MSLANKYRPNLFTEICGQGAVAEIRSDLASGDIKNYIFAGHYGSGKTTAARIFAKSLNCDEVGVEPCNECGACKAVDSGNNLYVKELDAASFGRVDTIRGLINELKYNLGGKYKVYILDEVQSMSSQAFEALLKILEEPPKKVSFVLLTTEIWKIPDTIKSRCSVIKFNKIDYKHILDRLNYIVSQEEIDINAEALSLISEYADGSLRDAIKYVEQALSFGESITEKTLKERIGLLGDAELSKIERFIIDGNGIEDVLVVLNKVNYRFVVRMLLKRMFKYVLKSSDFSKFYEKLVSFYKEIEL